MTESSPKTVLAIFAAIDLGLDTATVAVKTERKSIQKEGNSGFKTTVILQIAYWKVEHENMAYLLDRCLKPVITKRTTIFH